MRLTSRSEKIKRLRRLVERSSYRRSEQAFVVEGPRAIEAGLRARADIEAIYYAGNLHPGHEGLIKRAFDSGYSLFEVEPGVLEPVLDLSNAQPIAAIASMPASREIDFANAKPIVVVDQIRDPGNAGTIIRSAHGAGVLDVVFGSGSVDPYNAKVVRSSAGSIFFVNLHLGASASVVLAEIKAAGYRAIGASADGGTIYSEADLANSLALVIGNEADGISPEVFALLDLSVRVPTASSLESLNASMAATVLLFESLRQRSSEIITA